MRDYIELGTVPFDEEDTMQQVGAADYDPQLARFEASLYAKVIRREYGEEPVGARLGVKSMPHEMGNYYEVVCYFDDNNDAAISYAFKVEEGVAKWPDWAKAELQDKKNPVRITETPQGHSFDLTPTAGNKKAFKTGDQIFIGDQYYVIGEPVKKGNLVDGKMYYSIGRSQTGKYMQGWTEELWNDKNEAVLQFGPDTYLAVGIETLRELKPTGSSTYRALSRKDNAMDRVVKIADRPYSGSDRAENATILETKWTALKDKIDQGVDDILRSIRDMQATATDMGQNDSNRDWAYDDLINDLKRLEKFFADGVFNQRGELHVNQRDHANMVHEDDIVTDIGRINQPDEEDEG